MKRFSISFSHLIILALGIFALQSQAQVSLKIEKIDTTQYPKLKVSITTRDGGVVNRNLNASAFTVSEDGFPQSPITYNCPVGSSTFSIAFLIGTGSSMSQANIDIAKGAANSLVSLFDGVNDEGTLISYSSIISTDVFLTTDKVLIQNGINNLAGSGGQNRFWDGLATAISEIKNNGSSQSLAVVVISNGMDNASTSDLSSVTSIALNAKVKVYCVNAGAAQGSQGAQNLQGIAMNSGGRYWGGPSGGFEQTIVNLLRGTPEACILEYSTNGVCQDGHPRLVHIEATIGNQTGSVDSSYLMKPDGSTFQPVLFKVDTGTVSSGNTKALPLLLKTPLVNKRFYPAQAMLSFDTSKIKLIDVSTSGTLSDSLIATVTTIATGARIDFTKNKMITGSGVFANMNFQVIDVQQAINVPISLTSFVFTQGCFTPQLAHGQLVIVPKRIAISHIHHAPANITWNVQQKNYSPNPITVTATITNTGEVPLTNIQGKLKLQTGLRFVSGYNETQSATPNTLDPLQQATIRWDVDIDIQTSQQTFVLPLTTSTTEGATSSSTVVFVVDQAGAKLSMTCTAPTITVDNGTYKPNPFPIGLIVQNAGAASAAPQATIQLPAGLALENDQATKSMTSIVPLSQGQVQWQVRTQTSTSQKTYDVLIIIQGTDIKTDTCTVQVITPGLLPSANLTTSCILMSEFSLSPIDNRIVPNPFSLRTAVYNKGTVESDSVTLILTLPAEIELTSPPPMTIKVHKIQPNDSVYLSWNCIIRGIQCSDKTVRILLDVMSGGNIVELCYKDVLLPGKPVSKPVITSSLPTKLDTARVGDTQQFSVQATDPNNDKLHYVWKLDGSSTGSDTSVVSIIFSTTGKKNLTCIVTDGCTSDSVTWTFYVDVKTGVDSKYVLVAGYSLLPNYPNPIVLNGNGAQSSTLISFTTPNGNHYVEMKVLDIVGKEIATIVSGMFDGGLHQVTFDPMTHNELRMNMLQSGIYFYRMISGAFQQTRPLLIMK